ncbi:MAG: COX15/CtaA family protein, partial [Pseudomonadota bacterium]
YFAIRGQLRRDLVPLVVIAFLLGAGQGVWGWYMVQSGLVDRPSVSQYRLAGHLGLAFVIFALLIWMGCKALRLSRLGLGLSDGPLRSVVVTFAFVTVTVFWGALVAGLDAGLAYNTYPLMGGQFVPEAILSIIPAWKNFFENTATVQFIHRWLAIATLISALWTAFQLRVHSQSLSLALAVMVTLQVVLGITTLLTFVALPLATAHQAGAFILVAILTVSLYRLSGAPELRAKQHQHGEELQPAQ